MCLPLLRYIDDASLLLCVHTEAGSNKRAYTCAIVVETRVSTRLARVISKYYRFPREEEARFCLAGRPAGRPAVRSFSVLLTCVRKTLLLIGKL